jgi:two-component system C4-dicarboxylate transport response regulator DctD
LIESELFGHEAGAFPGATRARFGKFENAQGGTVLLDEIGTMPLNVQDKLLRVIEDRVITRLGSNDPKPLDVRFIATSKADLESEVAMGRLRPDLMYKLNVVTITVPPLRARRADIPALFLQLVHEAAVRYRRAGLPVPPAVLTQVAERDWPGNVRELRNAADRFVLGLGVDFPDTPHVNRTANRPLAERVAEFEKGVIAAALQAHGGRLRPVYESLGLSRKTLYEKMQKYDLRRTVDEPQDQP